MLALVTLVSVLNGLILLPLILSVVGPAPVQITKKLETPTELAYVEGDTSSPKPQTPAERSYVADDTSTSSPTLQVLTAMI
jgi:hypothetical protein